MDLPNTTQHARACPTYPECSRRSCHWFLPHWSFQFETPGLALAPHRIPNILAVLVPAHSTFPHYLSSLINNYHPSRSLRSSNRHLLDVSRSKSILSSRGLTSFRTVGPQIRNSHDSVRQSEFISVSSALNFKLLFSRKPSAASAPWATTQIQW